MSLFQCHGPSFALRFLCTLNRRTPTHVMDVVAGLVGTLDRIVLGTTSNLLDIQRMILCYHARLASSSLLLDLSGRAFASGFRARCIALSLTRVATPCAAHLACITVRDITQSSTFIVSAGIRKLLCEG